MTGSLTFEDPWLLLLLPLLAVLAWWLRRRGWARGSALSVSTLEGLRTHWSWRVVAWRVGQAALGLATALAVVALARPQRQFVERDEEAEGIDIVLAMDLSTSMLAKDFEPDRLEASKAVAQRFVADRPYDRIGLVAFAGDAFTQSPLTLDHRVLQTMLGQLRTGLLQDGTAIGQGLATAVNALRDSEAQSRVVILLTDGVNNSGYIDPATAAGLAEEFGVRVYTIGVGTNGRALSPIRFNDNTVRMQYVRVQIDERLLRRIAERTGGRYFRATDNASLEAVYAQIDELEKTAVEVSVSRRFDDRYHVPLAAALVLGLLGGVMRVFVAPRVV